MYSLADSAQEVTESRDAVAARITPRASVVLEGSDLIRIVHRERQVRIYFRKRIDKIRVLVTSITGLREVERLVEVDFDSPDCERALSIALAPVGARLKKR